MSIFVKKSQTSDKVSFIRNARNKNSTKEYYGNNMKALIDNNLHSNNSIITNWLEDNTKVFMRQDDNQYCSFLEQTINLLPRELNTLEYIDSQQIEHFTFERYNFLFTTYEAEELDAYYKKYVEEWSQTTGEKLKSPFPFTTFALLSIITQNPSNAYKNHVETVGGTHCVKPWVEYFRNNPGPTGTSGNKSKVLVKYIIPDIYLTSLLKNELPSDNKYFIFDLSEIYDEGEIDGDIGSADYNKVKMVKPSMRLWNDILSNIDFSKKIEYIQTDNRLDKGGTLMLFWIDD